ncbi:MAG: polymer-forming cytoskeletal protein [Candidatus Acidiferrum sp.]
MSDQELTTNKHLSEITLLMYVERQLDRENAQEVSLHTQTCARCMNLLRALDRESRLLTRAMLEQDEPLPARLANFQFMVRRSMQWIWGVIFGLAVMGVYALYTGYIEPMERQFEQAGFGGTNLLSLLLFQGAFWKGWQSMFTLLQAIALAVLLGLVVFGFRKYIKRGSALAMMFASLALVGAISRPVDATEFRNGDTVQVKKGETIVGDIYLSGQNLRVEGTVEGDVYAFGQQVDVSGHIEGDLICFAQSARVSGHVDGNIRSFVNNVTVSGEVGRSFMAMAESLTLDSNAKVGGSLTALGQSVAVDGKVGRDFLGFFQQATISGVIGGSMTGRGQSLSITGSAEIDGKAKFDGEKEANVSSDAKLTYPLEYKKLEHKSRERGAGYYIWRVIWGAGFVLFGLVLFGVMPRFASDVVDAAENIGASFGLGVLVLPGVFIAACIACILIVGIFVGISTLLVWFIALLASEVVVGALIGRWIMGRTTEFWPMVGRMTVGIAILTVVTHIPWVGGWAKLAMFLWGMGAIALGLYRRLQPMMAPNIPSVPMGPVGTPLPPTTTVGAL